MTPHRHVGAVFLAALVCAALVEAVPSTPPKKHWALQFDTVFQPWHGKSSPGCAVGVFKDGRIIFDRGYGMADLEHDVPIDGDSVFYVGSVAKPFTAFAAALAIEQRRMSADDSIRKFLPELPTYADAITVRHLIHHTSGLRDYHDFFRDEIDARFEVSVKGDTLMLQRDSDLDARALEPAADGSFRFSGMNPFHASDALIGGP